MLLVSPAVAETPAFESPPVLEASSIAGDIALSGDSYSVAPAVPTDGFMASFTIVSPFGDFTASGPGMLAARITEVTALAALQGIRDDDQFKAAAADQARDTAGALQRLAAHPRQTLEGVPEGVGRFFNRTGRSIRTGAQKLGDVQQGRVPGVDPNRVSQLPGGPAPVAGVPDTNLAGRIARAGGDVALNTLGFDEQRRHLAQTLGVDPYTTNPVLAAQLDDVTWAAFAGGLGMNMLTSMIPGGMLISTSSQLTNWVWETAPGDLRVEIETTLLSIGVGQAETDRFLRHQWYTLSMQAALAASLRALDGVAGRADVIALALTASSEGQGRFVVQTVEMLANHHAMDARLSALVVEGTVIGSTDARARVVMAPVDYLSWGPVMAGFAERLGQDGGPPPALHVSGRASERARGELAGRGWTVFENSRLGPVRYPLVAMAVGPAR